MTTGGVARFQAEDFSINHLLTEQHQQPLHRPDKLGTPGSPAHALGNGQIVQGVADDLPEQIASGLTFFHRAIDQPCTFGGIFLLKVGKRDPIGTGKTECRLAGIALGVVSGSHSRPFAFKVLVRLGGIQTGNQQRQTTGGSKRFAAVKADLRFFQPGNNALGERFAKGFQRLWRQLFGTQLDQKVGGIAVNSSSHYFSSCASCARTSLRIASSAMGKPSACRLSK